MTFPGHFSDLISDLTFYRDLKEDLRWNEATIKMLIQLENSATSLLMEQLELQKGNLPVNVIVAGNFNAGKSSFINSLLSEDLCCVGSRPVTASITRFHYGDTERIVLHSGREINRENYLKISRHHNENLNNEDERQIDYYYPLEKLRNISITDTPGFSSTVMHENDSRLTMDYCRMADAVILIININDGTIGEDLLQKIRTLQTDEPSPPWYLIANWADSKPEFKAHKILEHLKTEFNRYFQDFFLYSAKPELYSKNIDRREAIFHLLQNISRQKKELLRQKSDRFSRKYQQMRSLHLKRLHECMRFVTNNEHSEKARHNFCGELKIFLRRELNTIEQNGLITIEQIRNLQENFNHYICESGNINDSDKDFCAFLLSETDKLFKPYNHSLFRDKPIEKEKITEELCSRIDFSNGFWSRQQQLRQKTCQKIKLFLQNCA